MVPAVVGCKASSLLRKNVAGEDERSTAPPKCWLCDTSS